MSGKLKKWDIATKLKKRKHFPITNIFYMINCK